LDELLTTELIFDNLFAELEPEEITAILCTMLCKEKDDNAPTISPVLEEVS
jgi:antiviral helicase SKI2